MKFEYKRIGFLGWTKAEVTRSLNKLGRQGWELIAPFPDGRWMRRKI